MMYMTRSRSRLLQAVLVLVFLAATQLAHGQLQGLLLLQMKTWLTYTPDYIRSHGTTVTYASTATICFNGGGVPTSDPTTSINNQIRYHVADSGVGPGLSFYTGSSAQPTAENPLKCVDRVQDTSATLNSANCVYRWRYGYYDLYNYMGEPGTAYWKGLYPMKSETPVLNQYEQYTWNNTAAEPDRYPRGHYFTINGYGPTKMLRMDVKATPVHNDPNPIEKYMAVCEVQLYPQHPPTTTRMPQPLFKQGFKTLTWPQEHWWVIFLIVALVLLAVLLGIIIYCCLTSVKPKEELPLHSMVLRERVGVLYILVDAQKKLDSDTYQQNKQQQWAAEVQQRRGRGFNQEEQQPHDPEDLTMGTVGIFGYGERSQYDDGNVVANFYRQTDDTHSASVMSSCLREEEKVRVSAQPPPQEAEDASEGLVKAPKRKSARRGRGRTLEQTFCDVDVPQADEIEEINLDL